MTGIKYNSLSHKLLLFAKMKNKPLSVKDFKNFSPKVFYDNARTNKSLRGLSNKGFINCQENKWFITPEGINYLYSIARPYRGE